MTNFIKLSNSVAKFKLALIFIIIKSYHYNIDY